MQSPSSPDPTDLAPDTGSLIDTVMQGALRALMAPAITWGWKATKRGCWWALALLRRNATNGYVLVPARHRGISHALRCGSVQNSRGPSERIDRQGRFRIRPEWVSGEVVRVYSQSGVFLGEYGLKGDHQRGFDSIVLDQAFVDQVAIG